MCSCPSTEGLGRLPDWQSATGGAAMSITKVAQAVQLLQIEYRPVLADQEPIQRALTADAKAALHIPFQAELTRDVTFAAQLVDGNEHRLRAAGVDSV